MEHALGGVFGIQESKAFDNEPGRLLPSATAQLDLQ